MTDGLALGVFLGLNFVTALSGAWFRPGAWYEDLAKPGWRPPNWLFGPVWLVLYIMIAVSGWLVWRAGPWEETGPALLIYGAQLVLNAGWSAVFFGLRRPGLAFIEITLLWISIVVTKSMFEPIDSTAALLLWPYLIWVSFAAALNWAIWRMNRNGPAAAQNSGG